MNKLKSYSEFFTESKKDNSFFDEAKEVIKRAKKILNSNKKPKPDGKSFLSKLKEDLEKLEILVEDETKTGIPMFIKRVEKGLKDCFE